MSNFCKNLGRDEQGNLRLQLGTKYPVVYVKKGLEIYRETTSGLVLVTPEEHASRTWIAENFSRERRKQVAEVLQRTHIPSQDRRAYNKRMGRVWA